MNERTYPIGKITKGDTEWVIVCGTCHYWDIHSASIKVTAISKFVEKGWRHNADGKWTCKDCLKRGEQ